MEKTLQGRLIVLLCCIVLLCLVPVLVNTEQHKYVFDIIFNVNVAVMLATSWNILGGFAGQVSFGHAGFVGIGAYTVALLHVYLQWNPWYALPLSALSAMASAVLVGGICFRLRGPYFALSTLAMAEVMKLIVEGWRVFTQGTQGLVIRQKPFMGLVPGSGFYYEMSLWLTGLAVLCGLVIRYSTAHYFFVAVGENEDAALAVGVSAWKYKMIALLLSAGIAGMVGGLIALHTGFIDPESGFDMARTVEPIFLTIVGGIGTVLGPVVGSLLLVPVGEWFRSQFPTAHLLLYGVLLVIFARFMPKGIMGLLRRRP